MLPATQVSDLNDMDGQPDSQIPHSGLTSPSAWLLLSHTAVYNLVTNICCSFLPVLLLRRLWPHSSADVPRGVHRPTPEVRL